MYLKLRIGALMNERQMTEAELAKRAKIARNTVRSLRRGVNTRVDLEVLEKIATALAVRPMELFEETETKPGNSAAVLAFA